MTDVADRVRTRLQKRRPVPRVSRLVLERLSRSPLAPWWGAFAELDEDEVRPVRNG